jgi:hypothetical protein
MHQAIATYSVLLCGMAAYDQFSDAVAYAAQAFAQEDDITVLTLALVPAEALHA